MSQYPVEMLSLIARTPDYLVVNKPPGMVTQGADADGNLLARIRMLYPEQPAYPVHRLDAGTSGLVLVATTGDGNVKLSRSFQNQAVQKIYLALIDRRPSKKQGKIIGDMAKSRDGNWMLQRTRSNAAITTFFSVGLGDGLRLVVLQPKTGKTHQLRVAMKSVGAPILGDSRYGGTPADRLYLHAWQLILPWDDEVRRYVAPTTAGVHFQTAQMLVALRRVEETALVSSQGTDR